MQWSSGPQVNGWQEAYAFRILVTSESLADIRVQGPYCHV